MRLDEQNNGTVMLDGTTRKLPILIAFEHSSAVYWFKPEYPAARMAIRIGNEDGSSWKASVEMLCHPKRGMFSVRIDGANFTGRYETVYQVITFDEDGAEVVSGEGILRVYGSSVAPANGDVGS